ncbi:MAG: DsbA family protein [Solirubrobacteraceae bacterium]|nr:DsbA family protein [Solirubrobacteraceae bacterium]
MTSGSRSKQEAARKARLEREAAERAAQERKKRLGIVGGVIALVVVLAAIVVIADPFKGSASDDASDVAGIKGVNEVAALTKGIPQDGLILGDPNAPVTIVEFIDMKCPHCAEFSIAIHPTLVDKLVRTGKANLEMRLVNVMDGQAGTVDGDRARTAVNNQTASDNAWNLADTIFYNQGGGGDEWATENRLKEIAAQVPGVGDELNVRETAASRALRDEADKLAGDVGVTGTPSIFVRPRGTKQYTSVPDFTSADAIIAAVEAAAPKAEPVDAETPAVDK